MAGTRALGSIDSYLVHASWLIDVAQAVLAEIHESKHAGRKEVSRRATNEELAAVAESHQASAAIERYAQPVVAVRLGLA
jgi:hypothetical protein